jgi:putative redox protein
MENSISWIGDLGFKCKNRNHEIILDVDKASGSLDRGPTPKEVLLSSAASCSAMDVMVILKKMRDLPTEFDVEIENKKNKNFPIYFTHITLHYKLKGNTKPANVIKAVEASLSKYCGVSYMISKVCEISYTISLNGEEIGKGISKFIDPSG